MFHVYVIHYKLDNFYPASLKLIEFDLPAVRSKMFQGQSCPTSVNLAINETKTRVWG